MALTVEIAGVDRTAGVVFREGTPRKSENLNQKTDSFEFRVRKYGSLTYVPTLGQEVIVERNGTTIFGGVIVRITETLKSAQILEYAVSCNDYSQYLKRELVTERYEGETVGSIIADIIANYTTDGFTTVNVVGGQEIGSIAFSRLNVADCLQKLADTLSYVWYVDYDRDIHFFPKNTETGPALSDTSGNFIYDSLEIVEDLSQVRNVILVQGGEQISATPRTEHFSGDGTRAQFALANKFDKLPTITVGGVGQTVGVEYLDDDTLFDCMWSFNEKYVRFTSGNIPGSGTNNIEVAGTYLFPIVVNVPNLASIAEFGRYEFAITDTSIRSQSEAIDRAIAELKSYQNELYEGSFRTYDDGFRSGQVIEIVSAQRSKNIEVLVQSVNAVVRDPLGNQLDYQVRFATLKSIGIIEYLQGQLRSKEVIVDDQETLLNFFGLADETSLDDTLAAPMTSTGPYVWGGFNWGYGVWQ
ncbi:hypothetical protein [Parerythrobacter lacustris]|uniref:DUF4815 domain-containing protein n=1 Tax=Parerythrobacter lacustris TaxID=2969984 RepID=A0ABT1XQE2_9SPHN|nr:hypothetical protein [Parerythrobacter lacustris]MCR2833474.1 hypothetical protein [Parerythrobacter lacustris]